MKNEIDTLETMREKYITLSRHLKTPINIKKIKFFNWVGLIFSALSTSYFLHWGLTASLFYFMDDSLRQSGFVLEWGGYVIVWPVFAITTLIGLQFSVAFYTSTYSNTAQKVHDLAERKSRRWFQNLFVFERSLDNLFIRFTGIAGMIMIGYSAVNTFNEMVAQDAEFRQAQKEQLSKYQNTASLEEKIQFWTGKQVNGKNDDDAQADSMLAYYNKQLRLYNQRADSLNNLVYNKAEISTMKSVDVTASIKFISRGDKILFGFIIILLLGIIAAANDGSVASMTKLIACHDQAKQAEEIYKKENSFMEDMLDGNITGNRAESGSASKSKADFRGGKDILESDSAKAIIYAKVKDPAQSNRQIGKALGYSHTWVNEVLTAWREQQQKYEEA